MRKKELAAQVLGHSITCRLLRPSGARRGSLRILAYHRVLDDADDRFLFDEEVISAGTESFYKQMEFARRNFDVISFRELWNCEREARAWPERALIITFDDGYRDNYTHVFPVLREFGLGATIFLVTGHIGKRKLFWWDLIAYCIKHTERKMLLVPEFSQAPLRLDGPRARKAATESLLRWVKRIPEADKKSFLDNLPVEVEVELPGNVAEGMHLSWEEIRRMAEDGIEFGSHTVTHPILANVDEEQLNKELLESKKAIEENLGRQTIALAYPVGESNKLVREASSRCGFQYAVSYEDGIASEKGFDRYSMPRIAVERNESFSLFRAKLIYPQLMLRRSPARFQERAIGR